MKKIKYGLVSFAILLSACQANQKDFDASGNFEADEVIVSAQQSGVLLNLAINEGEAVIKNKPVGQIDVEMQQLQRQQNRAVAQALQQKTVTPNAQINVTRKQLASQQTQLANLQKEKKRIANMVAADAAPGKQLDDIEYQIEQLLAQMQVTRSQLELYNSNATTQNRGILSETAPLNSSAAQIDLQIARGQVINPIDGIVLTKYALPGELATVGKPLYKVANLDTITLKAYITGDQLPKIKIGDTVKVRIDDGNKNYKYFNGQISWVAGKAEFTPKTIQTKNERDNLVYGIKVPVKNDGSLKIGMYGEVIFK